MKKILKKFLVCILIIVIASNFVYGNFGAYIVYAADGEISFGAVGSNLLTGLIGLLTWTKTLPIAAAIIGISTIIGALAKVSVEDISSYTTGGIGTDAIIITPYDILFNRVPIVDINFFDFEGVNGTILQFRQAVAGWYYTMRLIAAMILLVILIYIGIRMALTSIASEKAMYKKMLVDWATSLALLFLLHYIMLFVMTCNNVLVDAMKEVAGDALDVEAMMSSLQLLMFHIDIVIRVVAGIVYGMILFQTISFLIAYIKRMFTIGFLIIIAPLITITYSIDKIGDGKSQALNTWLKEFSYNILLQPFQCIVYLVFAKLGVDLLLKQAFTANVLTQSNVGVGIFAILCLQFVKEGEKIVKKIFGFGKASTAGDLAAGAALTAGAIMKGGDIAKKYGGTIAAGKNKLSAAFANTKAGKALEGMRKDVKQVTDKITGNSEGGDSSSSGSNSEKSGSKKLKNRKDEKEAYRRAYEEWHKDKIGEPDEATIQKHRDAILKEKEDKKAEKLKNSNTPLAKIKKAREDKFNQEAERRAQEKWEQAGNTTKVPEAKVNEEKNAMIEKEKKEKQEKKERRITGVKNFFGAPDGSTTIGAAINGMNNWINDNSDVIKGATVGLFTAGIGLGAGDFGDISKAVAGYGMGKGFMEGYYANSASTVQSNCEGAAQLCANLSGTEDINAILGNAFVAGKNELSKDIKEALKQLNNSLRNFENRDRLVGTFSSTALNKDTAGTITRGGISEMLDRNGFSGTNEEKQQIVDNFSKYGTLLGYQTLYSNIQAADGMNVSMETLGAMIGDKQVVGSNVTYSSSESQTEVTTETTFNNLSAQEFANEVVQRLGSDYVNKIDSKEIDNKIAELNSLINAFKNNSNDYQIVQQINATRGDNSSSLEIINDLQNQVEALNKRINPQSN